MSALFTISGAVASASTSLLSSVRVCFTVWLSVGLEVDRIATSADSSNDSSRQSSPVTVCTPVGCRWAWLGIGVPGPGVSGGEGSR